ALRPIRACRTGRTLGSRGPRLPDQARQEVIDGAVGVSGSDPDVVGAGAGRAVRSGQALRADRPGKTCKELLDRAVVAGLEPQIVGARTGRAGCAVGPSGASGA